MDKRVFKEVEAANYICMSRSFLSQDRVNGTLKNRTPGPKFIKIGRAIRYLKKDLDIWLDLHRKP
ncbi:TPA: DNA-binding protein [Legionella pneumophila]|nr:DNA-binding protein [Legionella pneumophila]